MNQTAVKPTGMKSSIHKFHRQLRRNEITIQQWWKIIERFDESEVRSVIEEDHRAERRLREYKDSYRFRMKIRKYCNYHGWSDIEPYEVVKVISEKCVEIRGMNAELVKAPSEFHPGGFSGHYADNHNQEWKCTSDESRPIVRIRLGKKGWDQGKHRMSDTPRKFYDYNF